MTFKEIRLSSIIQRCCFEASWNIARVENIKTQVLSKKMSNHAARVEAQTKLNNIEHHLNRAKKCLNELRKTNTGELYAAAAYKGCIDRLSKIKSWYE